MRAGDIEQRSIKNEPTETHFIVQKGHTINLFYENDDVTKRKLALLETYSIGQKRAKKKRKIPNGDYS